MQRFVRKFGSNIIEMVFEGIPKAFPMIKESNVEKIGVFFQFYPLLNEIQFKRLKYLDISTYDTQDLDPLEVFIEHNKQNIKHLNLFVSNNLEMPSNKEKIRVLNIISKLSNFG